MPKTKNNIQNPTTKLILFEKRDKKIKIIPIIKKLHNKICGIFVIDSKNIPKINDRQRKNNILDGVIYHYLTWQSLKYGEISVAMSSKNFAKNGFTFSNSGSIVFSGLKFCK